MNTHGMDNWEEAGGNVGVRNTTPNAPGNDVEIGARDCAADGNAVSTLANPIALEPVRGYYSFSGTHQYQKYTNQGTI